MGGMVGLRLAARRPDLVKTLALLGVSAEAESPERLAQYRKLAWVARWFGLWAVVGSVLPVMFGPKFLSDPAHGAEWKRRVLANNRAGIIRATLGVIERTDVSPDLAKIRAPTLILVGQGDRTTSVDQSQKIHAGIAGSRIQVIPDTGHLCSVEDPATVNAALSAFWKT
jgi:pimeloyl-ACP methyl ester carboxylesterase